MRSSHARPIARSKRPLRRRTRADRLRPRVGRQVGGSAALDCRHARQSAGARKRRLQPRGRCDSSTSVIVVRHLPAELYAEYEGTLAFLLLNEGKEAHGEWHRSQAQKLHEQLQNVRGSMELAHTIRRAVWPVAAVTRHPRDAWSTSAALQTIVSTILNSRA